MNRTGLFIALSLALVVGLVFGIFPELDLKLAALFYDAPTRSFPLKFHPYAALARARALCTASGPLPPAALTPPPWRPLAYAAATLFGAVTSGLRMAFGGHFFSDVATAGLVTFLLIWLGYGMIYRWQRSSLSDEAIDAALTRL